MAVSLYELSVPTYLQTLGAVSGFLEKGLAHCRECNVGPGEVVEHPLHRQFVTGDPTLTNTADPFVRLDLDDELVAVPNLDRKPFDGGDLHIDSPL